MSTSRSNCFNGGPRLPRRILREEGSQIQAKTGGTIHFEVETRGKGANFTHDCYLTVPSIVYRFPFLTVSHGKEPYPVTVVSDALAAPTSAASEPAFLDLLKRIFHDETTKNTVRQLLDAAS
jgi:hypothetical protein